MNLTDADIQDYIYRISTNSTATMCFFMIFELLSHKIRLLFLSKVEVPFF